ncbi:MAG: hypothetical protein N3G22_01470 [Candidatus Micrarchaeota archaeon]|nr:hypothetical protein [Candidatus Micrarchaeota archaeon]
MDEDLIKKARASLFALSALLSCAGFVLSIVAAAAIFFMLSNASAAIERQLDSAVGTAAFLEKASADAGSGSARLEEGTKNASIALAQFSKSSSALASVLESISAVPPFSLDKRIQEAAGSLKNASSSFSAASLSLNQSASSFGKTSEAIMKSASKASEAKAALEEARGALKKGIGAVQLAVFAIAFASALLFASVFFLAVASLAESRFWAKEEPADK